MYTLNCYMNTVTLKLYRTHELVERRNKCGLFVNTQGPEEFRVNK